MDGKHAGLRHRRLGTRLLPEIPEPPARLHRRLVERRELGEINKRPALLERQGAQDFGSAWLGALQV